MKVAISAIAIVALIVLAGVVLGWDHAAQLGIATAVVAVGYFLYYMLRKPNKPE